MEAGTVAARPGTGSRTIADLVPLAAEQYGDQAAQKHKVGDEWVETSYAELGAIVREIALGLADLGVEPGDKVAILAHTRPEWTQASPGILSAGATLVTIYQTNSPEECHYVANHSESKAIIVEDGEQLAKIRQVEDELPQLETIVVMDPRGADLGDALTVDDLRERGRARDEAEFDQRVGAIGPD